MLDYPLCGSFYGSDNIQKAFVATLGTLKAILLIISMIITIAVRKQPSEFNEAKAIAFAVYNQSFCLVYVFRLFLNRFQSDSYLFSRALLAVWLVINDSNYEIKYILRSIIVLWGCIMTIFFIFYGKMYYIAIGKDHAFTAGRSGSMSSSRREKSTSSSKSKSMV